MLTDFEILSMCAMTSFVDSFESKLELLQGPPGMGKLL
jgi:hypothetical protein